MKHRNLTLFLAQLLLFFAVTPLLAETVKVDIKDFQFQPGKTTINLGDTVEWTNQDGAPHTSTSDKGVWDSSTLKFGESFSEAFNKPGKFTYHCAIHPGMTGTVRVRTMEQTRVKIGKDIITARPKQLPIKLDLSGKNRNQVYLGSYIVNAQGGCVDCHSCPPYAPGHNPYLGETKQFNAVTYLAGGKAFGPFVADNITPNAKGRPAGLTLNQFKQVLRTGQDPHTPGNILQVMPWPVYGMMSDYDIEAVYAYLSSIPRVAKQPSPEACP